MFNEFCSGMVHGFEFWLVGSFVLFMIQKWNGLTVKAVEAMEVVEPTGVFEEIVELVEELVETVEQAIAPTTPVVYLASEIESFETVIQVPQVDFEATEYTLKELRNLAVGSGIKNYRALKKDVLMEALKDIGRI